LEKCRYLWVRVGVGERIQKNRRDDVTGLNVSAYRSSETRRGQMKRSKSKVTGNEKDQGFQDSILSMLEWLADRDPVRAASLINAYLDDLSDELGGSKRGMARG
jgi:hypothetical protein